MKALLLVGLAPLVLAFPAAAQDHSAHSMPGMQMPARPAPAPKPKPQARPAAAANPSAKPPPKPKAKPPRRPARASHAAQAVPQPANPHADHDMSTMTPEAPAGDPHGGHDMSAMQGAHAFFGTSGTDLAAGNATAPAPEAGRAADLFWGAEAMAASERAVRREHGGMAFSKVMLNLAEVRIQSGNEGYRWEGEASYGGDINRLWVKSEGDGIFGAGVESAEVQARYGRAIGPYFNLLAGLRQDLGPGRRRTYAAVGFEGLAPYWFDVAGTVFLSQKGDLLARAEASYDERITQDLVLQPRVEFNLAAQDVPANRIGAGLSTAEAGLRLRYERAREFAPYIGVSWERSFGPTANFARARGDRTGGLSFVAGVRVWF